MYMCIYVCIYVCMYVCMCVCVCIFEFDYAEGGASSDIMYVCVYGLSEALLAQAQVGVCMHVSVCVCLSFKWHL